jgi:hypothetical protein
MDGVTRCVKTVAPYQCQISLPARKNRMVTLEAQAVDAAGNIGRNSIGIFVR